MMILQEVLDGIQDITNDPDQNDVNVGLRIGELAITIITNPGDTLNAYGVNF